MTIIILVYLLVAGRGIMKLLIMKEFETSGLFSTGLALTSQ